MGRFYTPQIVANMMVDLIPDTAPCSSAVDICCGSWNLLTAANNRWPNIQLTGVDTNTDLGHYVPKNSEFQCLDGRLFALNALSKNRKFSIVLANPPFTDAIISDQKAYKSLPGFSEIKTHALRRLETTMILANLAILEENGSMIVVVPNTVIKGESSRSLRAYIGNNFSLRRIVNLPSIVFGPDISTSIIYLQATGSTQGNVRIYDVKIDMNNNRYSFKYLHLLTAKNIRNGLWSKNNHITKINSTDYQILRGYISNSILKSSGTIPILHSTDLKSLNSKWIPTRYINDINVIPSANPYAERGDIGVSRVGRNSGVSAIYMGDAPIPVSDCIFLIKCNNTQILTIIKDILNCPKYLNDLINIQQGVNIKYLSIKIFREYISTYLEEKGCAVDDYTKTESACSG